MHHDRRAGRNAQWSQFTTDHQLWQEEGIATEACTEILIKVFSVQSIIPTRFTAQKFEVNELFDYETGIGVGKQVFVDT